jgi:putative DNA primase/helicase
VSDRPLEPTDPRVLEGERPWKGIARPVLDEAGVTIADGLVEVPYWTLAGEKHNAKVFRLAPTEGQARCHWERSGLEQIPFGLETLAQGADACIIAEGESDALAIREAFAEGVRTPEGIASGTMPVLGLPGALSWKREWAEHVASFRVVYVIGDGDDAGRKMAKAVAADVPQALIVELPEGEDARSLLQRDGARALDAFLDQADLDGPTCRDTGTESDEPPSRLRAVSFSQVKRERVDWLVPGLVPLGSVTVLAGVMGLGKSQWTCLVAAELSRGDLDGRPGISLLATAEDSLEGTVRPRLEALGADLDLVQHVELADEHDMGGLTLPNDLEELEALIIEREARLVVIDPILAHLGEKVDSYKDQSVRRVLAPLSRLAAKHRCAVVTVLHPNKATHTDVLARISGSGAFPAAARSTLLFARDPDDPDGEHGLRRALAHVKCNVGPLRPTRLYEVQPVTLPATANDPEVATSRLVQLDEISPHDGRSLLSAASTEEGTGKLAEAKEFLLGELGGGAAVPVKQLFAQAADLGISEKTVRRAKGALGVDKKKNGFHGGFHWFLPLSEGVE